MNYDNASSAQPGGFDGASLPERRGPRARKTGDGSPVDRLTPTISDAPQIAQVLQAVLPKLQSTVRVLQDLPQWVSDAMPSGLGLPTQSDAPLHSIQGHADRLAMALEGLRRYAAIEGYQATLQEMDIGPLLRDVVTRKLATRPGPVDLNLDLPQVKVDPLLVQGIAAGLTDAAITDARRAEDNIGFRAVMANETMRLSVIYAGPPFDPSALTALFQPQGASARAQHPAAMLGLAYVWRATALLGGSIEVGAGFMGAGARITVILPRA